MNQPVALLPQWVADSSVLGDGTGDDTIVDLTLATVVGYLYVRVQDDLIDEDVGDPASAMLLGDALLVHHVRLLAKHAGSSPRFWEFFESTAWAYADAMLLERELHHPGATYGDGEFDAVLRRSEPVIIPAAVILDRDDRWEHLPRLREFVHLVTRAGQLVDDLRDAGHDRDAGNYTWVVRQLGGVNSKGELLTTIVLGGFDDIVGRADRDLVRAIAIAGELDLANAAVWLEQRRAAIREMRSRFYEAVGAGPAADDVTE